MNEVHIYDISPKKTTQSLLMVISGSFPKDRKLEKVFLTNTV